MKAKVLRAYMVATLALTIFLLVVLAGLEILPTTNGNDDPVIQRQADLQLTRSIFMSRDVLILAYRPITNHSQAISDLQTLLPVFQQTQVGLSNGDASLGLPGNPPDNVKIALALADSDYRQMIVALKSILAHADSPIPDPIQTNIVLMHDRPYVTAMYQAITLIQQNADARKVQLLIIKIFFIVGIVVLVTLKYVLFTRSAVKKMVVEEEEEQASIKAAHTPPAPNAAP